MQLNRRNALTGNWDEYGAQFTQPRDGSGAFDGQPFDYDFAPLPEGDYRLGGVHLRSVPAAVLRRRPDRAVRTHHQRGETGTQGSTSRCAVAASIGGVVHAADTTAIPAATVQAFEKLPGTGTWTWLPIEYKTSVSR